MDAVSRDRLIAGAGTGADAWRADPALGAIAGIGAADLAPPAARLVVVAPHPDDEILACGGLLQLLVSPAPLLVAVTDGDASHPGSGAWPPARLRRERPRETLAALDCLGIPPPQIARLGIPDGGIAAREDALARRLAALFRPGDVVVTTWRYDGHPDHEATARACLAAADGCGARVWEAPVWGWHWSAPGDGAMPIAHARRLSLPAPVLARKRRAMGCFQSQLQPDPTRDAPPVVSPRALERVLMPFELYFHDPARTF